MFHMFIKKPVLKIYFRYINFNFFHHGYLFVLIFNGSYDPITITNNFYFHINIE